MCWFTCRSAVEDAKWPLPLLAEDRTRPIAVTRPSDGSTTALRVEQPSMTDVHLSFRRDYDVISDVAAHETLSACGSSGSPFISLFTTALTTFDQKSVSPGPQKGNRSVSAE